MAADKGRVEVIPLLLKAGAKVDFQNKVGMRGAGFESYPGIYDDNDESRTKLPHGFALPTASQQAGLTALYFCAANGHVEVVEMLIAAGANKNLQDNVGDSTTTPLSPNP